MPKLEERNLTDVTTNYFKSISKNFFPADKIEEAISYLNNNCNLAAKDHIIFVGMKKSMAITNDFYTTPYSEKMYIDGLAGVVSNLHEHLGMERPKMDKLSKKLETIVDKTIGELISQSRNKK